MYKKLSALLLAALLSLSTARAASIAVNFADTAALIGEDGAEKIAPGSYDFIFSLGEDGELFSGGSSLDGGYYYALLDQDGKRLTDQAYDMFSFQDGVVLFTRNGLYGAMRPDGEVFIPASYTQLVFNGEGGFLGLTTDCFDEEPDGLYLIDESGGVTATGVKTLGTLGWFDGGLMPLLSAENGLYGYVDASGQWAVRPQFAYAGAFLGERALASLSTGYGLIDRTGNWVLTPKYEALIYDDAALAVALQGGDQAIGLDPESCRELFRLEGENISVAAYDGFVQVFDAASTRLYDFDGRLVSQGSPQATYFAGENGQAILTDGPWGADCAYLIDRDGREVARGYKSLFPLFCVDGRGYYGFMTFEATATYDAALGEEVYEWDSNTVRYGVLDEDGILVLDAQYEELYAVHGGLLFVAQGDKEGVVDLSGAWLYQIDSANE